MRRKLVASAGQIVHGKAMRVGLLALLLLVGCRSSTKDTPGAIRKPDEVAPAAVNDQRLRLPREVWRPLITGHVGISDLRGEGASEDHPLSFHCQTLGPYGIRGSCPNPPPFRKGVKLKDESIDLLGQIGSCVDQALTWMPPKNVESKVLITLLAGGKHTVKVEPPGPLQAPIERCAGDLARQVRSLEDEPGTLKVSVSLGFSGWCDYLPDGSAPPEPGERIQASDIMAVRQFALLPTPDGHWLLSCLDSGAWRVRVYGGTESQVVDLDGQRVAWGSLSREHLVVSDASGAVLRAPMRGEGIGVQVRGSYAARPKVSEGARGWSVEPRPLRVEGKAPAGALWPLGLETLKLPEQAAAVALLLSGSPPVSASSSAAR